MTRPVRALIDLAALRHNYSRARAAAPGARAMAVIKADGYGHGLLRVARALRDADAFAVARIDEALALRDAGVTQRVLVMGGAFSGAELEQAGRQGVDVVVHHQSQLEMIEQAGDANPLRVWLKIDTGMHRLGIAPERFGEFWRRLDACANVANPVQLMTHFSCADDLENRCTRDQLDQFLGTSEGIAVPCSVANSAGVLGWPETHLDWVRPGIMLYGSCPFLAGTAADYDLRPVMTLSTCLLAVNPIKQGAAIGYGATWTCPEDMPVGVVAAGYGDGYPRHAPSGAPVLVNGRRAALIGRVSMDLITVDLRDHPDARPGDPVVLWGRGLPVDEVARAAGTIAYELLCKVTRRVEFYEEH